MLNAVSAKIGEDRNKILMKMEAVIVCRANEHATLEQMLEVKRIHASEKKMS